jgi:hypothetical protein
VGSDNLPGTYAHWLRHGTMHWKQGAIPPPWISKWPSRVRGPVVEGGVTLSFPNLGYWGKAKFISF